MRDGVARLPLDLVERLLELVVDEGLDLAAVLADEVVVVLTAGMDGLEAGDAGAEIDALDEPVARQLLERAVDGGDADPPAVRPEPVEDLLRGEAAPLARRAARSPRCGCRSAGGPLRSSDSVVVLDPVGHGRR